MKHLNLTLLIVLLAFSACQNRTDNQEEQSSEEVKKSGRVIIDGTKLTYQIEGKGMPCLVLATDPAYYSDKLRDHFEMYFINARYTAEDYTPISAEEYTLNTLFNDIDTLRAVMGLKKFVIMGHSIHGAVAYEYAKRYPEYVTHVIMIGSPNYTGAEVNEAVNRLWATASEERVTRYEENMANIEGTLEQLTPKEAFVTTLVAEGPKRWHDVTFDGREYFERMTVNLDLIGHLFGNLFSDYTMFKEGDHPNVPTFLVIGKSDYVVPYTLWEGKYDTLPNLTIEYFDKSGHTPQLEESDLFDKRLLEWISEN